MKLLELFESDPLNEKLKKVKGKWALVSRKNPKKVLQYYHGSGHPSKEWVSKVERRVHSFGESQLVEGLENLKNLSNLITLVGIPAFKPADRESIVDKDGTSPVVITADGRITVVVNSNGVNIPFYISTGEGGKQNVPTGKWYPFFGTGSDGWINKGSQDDINKYYNSKILAFYAKVLNHQLGDLRSVERDIPPMKNSGRSIINKDVSPMSYSEVSTNSKAFIKNVNDFLVSIGDRPYYPTEKKLDELGISDKYKQPIGMMELIQFRRIASEEQKAEMYHLLKNKQFKEATQLLQDVTGVKLVKDDLEKMSESVQLNEFEWRDWFTGKGARVQSPDDYDAETTNDSDVDQYGYTFKFGNQDVGAARNEKQQQAGEYAMQVFNNLYYKLTDRNPDSLHQIAERAKQAAIQKFKIAPDIVVSKKGSNLRKAHAKKTEQPQSQPKK